MSDSQRKRLKKAVSKKPPVSKMHGQKKVKVRCKAMNRDNKQCGHYTLRTPYCRQHLKKIYNLRVKPSKVPDAGFGLYTTKGLKKKQWFAPYTGERTETNKRIIAGPYVLQASKKPVGIFIDAYKTNTGPGRYAIDCKKLGKKCKYNAELVYNHKTKNAGVRALHDIPAGSEIFTSYGPEYFGKTHRRKVVAKELNKPEPRRHVRD